MVKQTVVAFGRLDVAYNNVGVQNVLAEAADTTQEDFDRVMGINLRDVWNSMKFELEQMRKARERGYRELLFVGWTRWRCGAWDLSRCEAWSYRIHQERGAGICDPGHSGQCCMPWPDLDAHGRPDGRKRSG